MGPQADVFLSYAREDAEAAKAFVDRLGASGLRVYWDAKLDRGRNYVQELDAHLDVAACIIVLWSRNSIASPYVQAEAMRGFEREVLVPVMIEPVRPPTPFGILQGAAVESDADWRALAERVLALVAKAATDAVQRTSSALSDTVRAARAAHQERVTALVDPLRRIASSTDVQQPEVDKGLAEAVGRLARDDLFSIAVVGRMKVGKSTLLNALLGPSEGVMDEPLPADDLPCTATLIKLRHADTPHCRPYAWDKENNAIGKPGAEWTFKDFHERARIYQDGAETNIFDSIAEFEVGWPSPLLRSGVTLIDSPGISEAPERTQLTRAAIATVDAAIVVYRSEPLAGTDEIEFAEEVTQKAGKVFTLVNLRGDHSMPPSPALQNVVRTRLKLSPGKSLPEHDVYFAHLKDGLKASYARNTELAEQSGLVQFQARIARFLMSERYGAHLLKTVRAIKPLGESLSASVDSLITATRADEARLREAIAACQADLETIKKKKLSIETLVTNAQTSMEITAQRSFEAKVSQIADAMPARLHSLSLGVDGFMSKLGAGTVQSGKWTKIAAAKISDTTKNELEIWATADSDKPGLAGDLKPQMDQLVSSLREQAEEIATAIHRMRERIASLARPGMHDPKLTADGKMVSDVEMAASLATSILLGPLGLAGVGGWRGVAGAVGGTVAASFGLGLIAGILHLAFPPTLVLSLVAGAGAIAGAVFGSTQGVEDRLKKKAWEQVAPKLRGIAQDPEAQAKLRGSIQQWFGEMKIQLSESVARIISIEQQNLTRLEALSRETADKAALTERLISSKAEIESIVARLSGMEAEIAANLHKPASAPA